MVVIEGEENWTGDERGDGWGGGVRIVGVVERNV